MPGCFADIDLTPNRIEEARKRIDQRMQGDVLSGGYIDLTSSNPTHQGLLFPPQILQTAAAPYWQTRHYTPTPHGLHSARRAIANYYATRSPAAVLPDDAIYITASTSEAYGLLFALLADPGDNLLAPNVTYPLFDYLAAIHHVELRSYRLDEARGWQIDGQSLLAQVDERTRGILIISPHNPTGAIVQRPLPELERTGLPLICDEVFAPFTYMYNGDAAPPLMMLHHNQPVLTLNGISKLLALPDLKLGWVVLNGPAQAAYGERFELLNDTFLGANHLVQSMLPVLFAQGMAFVDEMVSYVRANLRMALEMMEQCTALEVHPPDGGYYLFPSVCGWQDEEELVLFLLERGVLVHPGYFYGDVPGTHIMLSALTQRSVLAQGLEQLCAALEEMPG